VRAPNAYKYEEQPERVSKIIKGSILDNLIQHIPEGCPSAPEVASRATTPKTPRVATPSVSVEPPAAPVAAVAADNSGDNELAKQLLKGLAQKRFNNYDDWF